MKQEKIIQTLLTLAKNNQVSFPDMKSFHAAALIRNGSKVIQYAVNSPRSYVKGKVCFTIHAEEAAILPYFNKAERRIVWRGPFEWVLQPSKVETAP